MNSTPTQKATEQDLVAEIQRLRSGIRTAIDTDASRLEPDTVTEAVELLHKTSSRLDLGIDRTVVAFAGSTGSGKSSLFNAVSGLEIATVGVRRPTTAKPTACVWGNGGEEFLTWLGVPVDNRTWRESALDGDDEEALHGLILLDLPDHDSTAPEHRIEADRLVGMVDVVIWVVDPQKYADFSLHSHYLSKFAQHSQNMVVVLNQVDRLTPEQQEVTVTHLRSLLEHDGIDNARVHIASAVTRQGVEDIRAILTGAVSAREAGLVRLHTDICQMAQRIQHELGTPVADPDVLPGAERLVEAMSEAAGIDALTQTVHDDYVRRAYRKTGYPLIAWAQRGKADPLGSRHGGDRDDLLRAARPETTRTQSARVTLAAHDLVAEVSRDLPAAWRHEVQRAEKVSTEELTYNLDEAVTSIDVAPSQPGWWKLAQFFQVLFLVCSIVGLVWLIANAVAVFVLPDMLQLWMWLGAAGLTVLGILGSIVTSSLAAGARSRGAQKSATETRERLAGAVEKAAASSYLEPISAVLRQHKQIYEGLSPSMK